MVFPTKKAAPAGRPDELKRLLRVLFFYFLKSACFLETIECGGAFREVGAIQWGDDLQGLLNVIAAGVWHGIRKSIGQLGDLHPDNLRVGAGQRFQGGEVRPGEEPMNAQKTDEHRGERLLRLRELPGDSLHGGESVAFSSLHRVQDIIFSAVLLHRRAAPERIQAVETLVHAGKVSETQFDL